MQELKSRVGQASAIPTSKAPEPISPIASQIEALAAQLACAQEGLTLLYMKLEPVRAVNPVPDQTNDRLPSPSPLEGRLADLIDAASFLSFSLSNLRGELRI